MICSNCILGLYSLSPCVILQIPGTDREEEIHSDLGGHWEEESEKFRSKQRATWRRAAELCNYFQIMGEERGIVHQPESVLLKIPLGICKHDSLKTTCLQNKGQTP